MTDLTNERTEITLEEEKGISILGGSISFEKEGMKQRGCPGIYSGVALCLVA